MLPFSLECLGRTGRCLWYPEGARSPAQCLTFPEGQKGFRSQRIDLLRVIVVEEIELMGGVVLFNGQGLTDSIGVQLNCTRLVVEQRLIEQVCQAQRIFDLFAVFLQHTGQLPEERCLIRRGDFRLITTLRDNVLCSNK